MACFRCPPGQMLNFPLSKTCNKYIFCYYGEGVLRKCENNQQFNTKTGKCDLAKNVDCVENRCSIYVLDTDLMYFPSASSCENYYICMSGQAKLLNCAEGLYFSTKCNCCDRSENVKCLIGDYDLPHEDTKQKRNHTDHFESLHTPTLIGETDKVKCPPIGRFLYQYIEDTTHYFTCINGKAKLYACSSGLNFDDKLKRCVSQKKLKKSSTESTEINSSEPSSKVYNCPFYGAQLMPHEDKNKYILCVNGNTTVFACPDEHYFDATNNACRLNFEELNDGEISIDSNQDFVQEDDKCPLVGKTTLQHAQRNKYYLCIEGKAAVFNCAPGLYFNVNLKSCTKTAFEVFNKIYTPALTNATGNIICPKFGTFKFPHLDNTKFYLCIDGRTFILACAVNEFFDAKINICRQNGSLDNMSNITKNSDIEQSTVIVTEIASNVICQKFGTFIFPHAQRNRYFVCIDGNAIGFACAEGNVFNAKTKTCQRDLIEAEGTENQTPVVLDEPVNIVCPSQGGLKFAHKEKNKFFLCINGMGSILACAQGSYFESETGACRRSFDFENEISETTTEILNSTEAIKNVQCPLSGIFVYPHVENNLYYVCLEGKSIVLTCPEGKNFDTIKKTCQKPIQIKDAKDQLHMVLDNACPENGSIMIPHKDRNKFYMCVDGLATIHYCAKGDFFDADTKTCRESITIGYDVYESIPIQTEHDEYQIIPNKSSETIVAGNKRYQVAAVSSEPADTIQCPIQGTVMIPHEKNDKFYLCIDGSFTIHTCAKGDVFDSEAKTCRESFASEYAGS